VSQASSLELRGDHSLSRYRKGEACLIPCTDYHKECRPTSWYFYQQVKIQGNGSVMSGPWDERGQSKESISGFHAVLRRLIHGLRLARVINKVHVPFAQSRMTVPGVHLDGISFLPDQTLG